MKIFSTVDAYQVVPTTLSSAGGMKSLCHFARDIYGAMITKPASCNPKWY